jgi:hypothetical protein
LHEKKSKSKKVEKFKMKNAVFIYLIKLVGNFLRFFPHTKTHPSTAKILN